MASNIQRGPRRMDASDWVRLKRVGGMNYFEANKSVENPPIQLESHTARRVYTEFGTSNIRLPASFHTDSVAAKSADYVLESRAKGTNNKVLLATRICDCKITSNPKKQGICPSCLHKC